ncbi:ATP-binding protein [Sulfurifustis variabilis]|uniref:ATP-binding protein n=1 Tax=Sulfurifustis variabilis TaxID=1675686 RepID=A0A1B4VCU0_9GAMM|nr:hypothetical protein [Sulfurifustis variabilis]BAU46847.1 ATP-binding protein [Sulfurifustis variabilis]
MDNRVTDIAIHLDSALPDDQLTGLEETVRREPSVISACLSPEDRHILLVTYDPEGVSSEELVKRLRARGVHASAFGL